MSERFWHWPNAFFQAKQTAMRWLFAAVSLVALFATPAFGYAQSTRVVVFKLEGPMGSRVRDRVVRKIDKARSLALVKLGKVLDETGLRPAATVDELAQATKLPELVDIVVVGETQRRGRRWKLSVTYLDPRDGSELGRDNWSARRSSGLYVAGADIAERLSTLVEPRYARGGIDDSGEDGAWWNKENQSARDDAEDLVEDGAVEDAGLSSDWTWLSIAGHVGALRRDLEAIATVVNNGRNPIAPADSVFQERRSYVSKGLGHMEVGVLAEFYPGMLLDEPFPFVGVRARFLYGLFLTTSGCQDRSDLASPCMPSQQFDIDSSQYEVYLGARGRYRFDELDDFTFFADLGWGRFGFGFAEEDLKELERVSVVPSLHYDYLRMTLSAEYQVLPKLLAINFEAGGHLGLGIGQQAKEIWGVASSGGSGWLVAVRANSEVADNVLLGIAFEYMTFSSTFRGQTACIEGDCTSASVNTVWEPWPFENSDPNAVTGGIADSVTDHYVRLAISVGARL